MQIKNLSNKEILANLKAFRGVEIKITADIIMHLVEVMRRQMDLEMGCSSLYDFCETELGYGEDESYVRVRAAEVVYLAPERFEQLLRERKLTLTKLASAQKVFRAEKERRKKAGEPDLTQKEKIAAIEKIAESKKSATWVLADLFPKLCKIEEIMKPAPNGAMDFRFRFSKEQLAAYKRFCDLHAHKGVDKPSDAFATAIEISLKHTDPERKPKRPCKTGRSAAAKPPVETGPGAATQKPTPRSYIPVHIDRYLKTRSGHQCDFVCEETGKRCPCTRNIQTEHIVPLYLGGSNDISNMMVLCGRHNRFMAKKHGIDFRRKRKQEVTVEDLTI